MIGFDARTEPELVKEANKENEWLEVYQSFIEDGIGQTRRKKKEIPRFRLSDRQRAAIRRGFK